MSSENKKLEELIFSGDALIKKIEHFMVYAFGINGAENIKYSAARKHLINCENNFKEELKGLIAKQKHAIQIMTGGEK